ncbi:MAG: hypothetical protein IT360_12625 [Gemmatimonadaceae bacterium]|nr:hypothetical protein [Gemmatimonadaceae bacterium]
MIRNPLLRVAGLLATVVGLSACDDSLGLRASLSVQFDTLSAYAMSQTPISFPAAYSAGSGIVVRVDPDLAFDVAFDLAGDGKVQLIPARRISSTRRVSGIPSATPRMGMQLVKGTFESMTKAPTGGYVYDSTFSVAPGEAVVVELASDACQFSLSQQLYAKLVVDSVVPARRQLYFRAVRDPNCGFRSLQPGVPKN